jgi:hypothetical protein
MLDRLLDLENETFDMYNKAFRKASKGGKE